VPVGTSVYACAGGKVISAGWGGAYGNRIEIQHADGVVTAYNHLSQIDTKVGEIVLPGEFIAKSGNTGNTTGPHLHLEVTKDGAFENPAAWLWANN
jgi:murein DD-endopeptidase MepM/ murein hydrolase activator NlpD